MMQPMNWDDVQVFLAIARQGTLGAAGRALKQSQPTMGRRLKALELSLGHTLFQRTSEGFVLTDEGAAVLSHAEGMEAQALSFSRQLDGADQQLEGSLRLSTSDWFGLHVLAPLCAAFTNHHPRVTIELLTDARLFSLARREADLEARVVPFDEPDVIQRRLMNVPHALYTKTGPAFASSRWTWASAKCRTQLGCARPFPLRASRFAATTGTCRRWPVHRARAWPCCRARWVIHTPACKGWKAPRLRQGATFGWVITGICAGCHGCVLWWICSWSGSTPAAPMRRKTVDAEAPRQNTRNVTQPVQGLRCLVQRTSAALAASGPPLWRFASAIRTWIPTASATSSTAPRPHSTQARKVTPPARAGTASSTACTMGPTDDTKASHWPINSGGIQALSQPGTRMVFATALPPVNAPALDTAQTVTACIPQHARDHRASSANERNQLSA